jgi:hypothetical protein
VVSASTSAGSNAIFTLPAGYRPASQQQFPQLSQGTTANSLNVAASGTVAPATGLGTTAFTDIVVEAFVSLDI